MEPFRLYANSLVLACWYAVFLTIHQALESFGQWPMISQILLQMQQDRQGLEFKAFERHKYDPEDDDMPLPWSHVHECNMFD